MSTICIYHHNCADGFAAAWVVRKFFKERGESVTFVPGRYQEPPPDVSGADVFIVDFSFKRPVLLDMAQQAKTITIIDHHKTAKEDLLDGLPNNVKAIFDMEHSGAMLTWKYFYTSEPPELIRHIEDRDLWRFALPHTREILASVFSFPYDFDVWDGLMERNTDYLRQEGEAIERNHFKSIHEFIAATQHTVDIDGYSVPAINAPYFFASDAGHLMCRGQPFAVVYYDDGKYRNFSLRSDDDGIDVSQIAKRFGGGGHRNAAGFKLPLAVVYDKMQFTPTEA